MPLKTLMPSERRALAPAPVAALGRPVRYRRATGDPAPAVKIEIGVLRRLCLDRRIGDRAVLNTEVAAWQRPRNASGARIKWKFTTERARSKLARAYPNTANESKSL
jgi:hypothetical protein